MKSNILKKIILFLLGYLIAISLFYFKDGLPTFSQFNRDRIPFFIGVFIVIFWKIISVAKNKKT
jgi:hypothetical protein